MDTALTYRRARNPFPVILSILILLAVILTIHSTERFFRHYQEQFNDCFNKNGIKRVDATDINRFVRFCQLDDGRYITQEVVRKGNQWFSGRIQIVEQISDVEELYMNIFPSDPPRIFENVVKYLLTMHISRILR